MAVGINGTLGKCMIRDGRGINLEVRRSLRDVFKKVPILCMKVQVINFVFLSLCLKCCLIDTYFLVTINLILRPTSLFVLCSFKYV